MTTATDELKIETADIQPCVKKLTIEILEPVVAKEYNKAFDQVRKTISVQGFRKGKAPKEIVERLYSDSVLQDVAQRLIKDSYEKALSEQNLKVYGDPSFENINVERGKPISFSAMVETLPDVSLPDFSEWEFERKTDKVDEESVENNITAIIEQFAELIPADHRIVKEGDYLVLNYKGTVDGKDEENLSGENVELIISMVKGYVLGDFQKHLIGMTKDEEKEFTVKLPKQFPNPALAEKEAVFTAKIISIKEKRLPDFNDDFVKANSQYKSVEEMRNVVKENLEESAKQRADKKLRREIIDRLIEKTSFDLPPRMITEYADRDANRQRLTASSYGIELEKSPTFDKADFDKQCTERGERSAREEILITAIAKKENISPDPKKVTKAQEEYLKITKDADTNARDAKRRALSLALHEVMTDSVFDLLYSGIKIKDTMVEIVKENKE